MTETPKLIDAGHLHVESLRPHIHVTSNSRDCDGPLDRYAVHFATEDDWTRAVYCGPSLTPQDVARGMAERFAAPTLIGSFQRTYHVDEPSYEDESYTVVTVGWTDETDEGFHSMTCTACVDPSCVAESHQRDHFAEAAGY